MGDKRTPLWLRLFGYLVIAYALSPIDLIPDFLPVVGYLDELILLPAGLFILIKFLPLDVFAYARVRADDRIANGQKYPRSIFGAIMVIVIWITVLWWVVLLIASATIA